MSIINNGLLLASGADAAVGYQISRSIRLNSADSAYFSRTPSSAGNRKTFTWSAWVKRSGLGSNLMCLADARTGSNESPIIFGESVADTLSFYQYTSGFDWQLRTTQVFRDVGAWFHLVVAVDTTQATAANRIKIYLNGSQITTFAVANYPSQNADTFYNSANVHTIGAKALINSYFDGYLADIYLLDGTATTPSTFAETDAVTGQWVPKTPTGISYGTNGFRLPFSDNSGTTSTTLGKDSAGSNNWSPNNFSVASGSGNDSLVDSPTSYGTDTGAGGEVRGNFCTLNPLDNGGLTLSNGNLDFSRSTTSWVSARSTFAVSSGKWYWEITLATGTDCMAGISKNDVALSSYFGIAANGWAYHSQNGRKYNNGSDSAYGNSWTGGNDIVGVAFDADAGSISFYKNGVIQNSGTAAFTGLTNGPYFPSVALYGTCTAFINFGQRAFAYTAPSGFKALCDTNLTAPTIAKPNTVFDVITYTGNGASRSITGLNFACDFLWIKNRNFTGYNHHLTDAVRGVTKRLMSNRTDAELTTTDQVTAYNSNGFSLGADSAGPGDLEVNQNNGTYVAWAWDAGTSTVTNNNGSISSQVRANASAGFSIVTWTGNGTAGATVGHSLGAAPSLIVLKRRSGPGNSWGIYHSALGATKVLQFDTNSAFTDTTSWNDTAPTSTVFSLGTSLNTNTGTYVAYCFAPVTGYSSFGSYVGNGSSDGVFVYTGFRPRWVMIKASSSTGDWYIIDTSRDTYNLSGKSLQANTSNAEPSVGGSFSATEDILSNGFKLRDGGSGSNGSSVTYVWAAFAESPLQYARAR